MYISLESLLLIILLIIVIFYILIEKKIILDDSKKTIVIKEKCDVNKLKKILQEKKNININDIENINNNTINNIDNIKNDNNKNNLKVYDSTNNLNFDNLKFIEDENLTNDEHKNINVTINNNDNDHVHENEYIVNPYRDYDYKAYHDKLTPPRQRNLHSPEIHDPLLLPIYTRGLPNPFRKVGTLRLISENSSSNEYRFLNLMGSKLHSGQFSYYAVPTRENDTAKFSIENNRKEIYDRDTIKIDMLDQSYEVNLDKNVLPLYAGIP